MCLFGGGRWGTGQGWGTPFSHSCPGNRPRCLLARIFFSPPGGKSGDGRILPMNQTDLERYRDFPRRWIGAGVEEQNCGMKRNRKHQADEQDAESRFLRGTGFHRCAWFSFLPQRGHAKGPFVRSPGEECGFLYRAKALPGQFAALQSKVLSSLASYPYSPEKIVEIGFFCCLFHDKSIVFMRCP